MKSDGDVIVVLPGTYAENLTVNTPNLTLKSSEGSGETTINFGAGVGIDLLTAAAGGFTLGGSEDHGFALNGGIGTTFLFELANSPNDVTISYNDFDLTGSASQGISVGAAGATGLTIENNTFIAEVGDIAIWAPDVVDFVVSYNTFTGPSVR